MTDWGQIQARIRKAKNSPDALVKLSELFQRTRDGMVAWELGAVEEKAERMSEAIKWYTVAAERFRRSEWKKKAEEALIRLGAPIPAAKTEPAAPTADTHEESSLSTSENIKKETPLPLAYGEIPEEASNGSASPEATAPSATTAAAPGDPARKKRRRGRRGGRGRRRKDGAAAPSLPTQAYAESVEAQPVTPETSKPLP